MSPIELKIFWTQLVGLANEQARALKRVAFSPTVTQAGDLSVGICDPAGRCLVNAETGAPGHMNTISNTLAAILEQYKLEELYPGDILVTNDPWSGAGHLFDVCVVMPVFNAEEKLIAFVGSSIHISEIGGYGMGAGARDVHEEGLWLPELKLYERGEPVAPIFKIIQRNVRAPDLALGDLLGQVACARKGAEDLLKLCAMHKLDDLTEVGESIFNISEQAMRKAIRTLKPGIYRGETVFDVLGGDDEEHTIRLKVALNVDAERGEITADFSESSPGSRFGINVVAGYAQAYVRFAVQCCLCPELPNNGGSHEPIKFVSPKGNILNAAYPSPVNGRHIIAHNVPFAVMNALYGVAPEGVVAESVGGRWTAHISGRWPSGQPFAMSIISFTGGMGARATKPGLAVTPFPSGSAIIPVEIIEATTPVVFERREIAYGTGGTGKQPGGDGEIAKFRLNTTYPWLLNSISTKSKFPPRGVGGGGDGALGVFKINGKVATTGAKQDMQPGDVIELQTPGGGGFGREAAAAK